MPDQPASRPDHFQSTDRNGRPGRHAARKIDASLHCGPTGQRIRAESRQAETTNTITSRHLTRLARRMERARGPGVENEEQTVEAILQRLLERLRTPDLNEQDQEVLERGRQRYRRDRERIAAQANSLRRRQGSLRPENQGRETRASPSDNETRVRTASARGLPGEVDALNGLHR